MKCCLNFRSRVVWLFPREPEHTSCFGSLVGVMLAACESNVKSRVEAGFRDVRGECPWTNSGWIVGAVVLSFAFFCCGLKAGGFMGSYPENFTVCALNWKHVAVQMGNPTAVGSTVSSTWCWGRVWGWCSPQDLAVVSVHPVLPHHSPRCGCVWHVLFLGLQSLWDMDECCKTEDFLCVQDTSVFLITLQGFYCKLLL